MNGVAVGKFGSTPGGASRGVALGVMGTLVINGSSNVGVGKLVNGGGAMVAGVAVGAAVNPGGGLLTFVTCGVKGGALGRGCVGCGDVRTTGVPKFGGRFVKSAVGGTWTGLESRDGFVCCPCWTS